MNNYQQILYWTYHRTFYQIWYSSFISWWYTKENGSSSRQRTWSSYKGYNYTYEKESHSCDNTGRVVIRESRCCSDGLFNLGHYERTSTEAQGVNIERAEKCYKSRVGKPWAGCYRQRFEKLGKALQINLLCSWISYRTSFAIIVSK